MHRWQSDEHPRALHKNPNTPAFRGKIRMLQRDNGALEFRVYGRTSNPSLAQSTHIHGTKKSDGSGIHWRFNRGMRMPGDVDSAESVSSIAPDISQQRSRGKVHRRKADLYWPWVEKRSSIFMSVRDSRRREVQFRPGMFSKTIDREFSYEISAGGVIDNPCAEMGRVGVMYEVHDAIQNGETYAVKALRREAEEYLICLRGILNDFSPCQPSADQADHGFLPSQMPSYCKVINLDRRLATERHTPIPIQYIWDVLGKYLQNITYLANVYAIFWHKYLLDISEREKDLGRKHNDTLIAMECLATTYQHLGRVEQARKLVSEVVRRRKDTLRRYHPHTLATMQTLSTIHIWPARSFAFAPDAKGIEKKSVLKLGDADYAHIFETQKRSNLSLKKETMLPKTPLPPIERKSQSEIRKTRS
ncbi:hypothetical protein B0H14DRAFT_2556213 [Mycena olivaceomarginata]|nr:hypothetical protein B0H14DRAFT_2556213 [Mycena olivaceomarginata]